MSDQELTTVEQAQLIIEHSKPTSYREIVIEKLAQDYIKVLEEKTKQKVAYVEVIKRMHVATMESPEDGDPSDPFCDCGLPMEHYEHVKCPHCDSLLTDEVERLREELRFHLSECPKVRSQVEILTADKDRLDKLLAQGIYLAHMSRQFNDRAHIDAHLSKPDAARNSEKERE